MSVAVRVMYPDGAQSHGLSSPPSAARSQGKGLSIRGRTAQIVNGKLVMLDAPMNDDPQDAELPLGEEDESPVASTSRACTPSASSSNAPPTRPKLARRQTRYFCTWEGCVKSYAKPVRLEEHLRSHTGERPYKCTHEDCGASYLRDTHLVAHMRTHLDEKDKPFTCDVDDCGKRFWTNQHLNRHVKLVHEQNSGAYKCEQCDAAFNKHNKLREHIVKDHMPEGTKPFFCPVEGCGKSFQTSSTLRTHSKLHDENRYVCMHHSHIAQEEQDGPADLPENDVERDQEEEESTENRFPHFATWSALQEHNKLEHPPTCPHPECNGRIFRNSKKLRKHCIKFHLDTLPQSEEDNGTAEEGEQTAAAAEGHQSEVSIEAQALDSAPVAQTGVRVVAHARNGTTRKRKSTHTSNDQLIPTQPEVFQDFDGINDYAEEPAQAENCFEGESKVTISNKRVRFI